MYYPFVLLRLIQQISGALSLGEDFNAMESTECLAIIHMITGKWISMSKVKGRDMF